MRTGWSEEELTIHECVRAAYNAGCEWVAIHGRTRTQGYEGRADWDLIREVKAEARIPIIGNGDIRDATKARQCLQTAGVDAVMIGRGALRNPWIFLECLGEPGGNPMEGNALLKKYLEKLRKYYDTRITLLLLTKVCHLVGLWVSRFRRLQAVNVSIVLCERSVGLRRRIFPEYRSFCRRHVLMKKKLS